MGKVKLAKHRLTQEVCAIKVVTRASKVWQRQHMNDAPTSDPNELAQRKKEYEKEIARDKRTIREAALGKILYHPYICRLYEMYSMSNHYYMLFEYVSGGQMLDYIVAHGSLKESQARKFCRGIGSALSYCHANNIVHRDLKIENIMITNHGEIKIIDFGLSNLYNHEHLLKTYCGSLYFAAPELLSAKPYRGPEVDIWSFGVVLFVLVCGRVPFDDKSVSNLHEKIKKGHIDYPNHLTPECVDLLKKMLVVDVTKRAKIGEILCHKWMNKGYGNIVNSYLPERIPLQLPLDPEIISEISNLNLGSNEVEIHSELTEILTSSYYHRCVSNWIAKRNGERYDPNLLDPTKGFHPLVSIYFLVKEMIARKRAKSLQNSNSNAAETFKQHSNPGQYVTPQIEQNPVFNVTSPHPNMVHEPQNRIVTQPVPQQYQHTNKNGVGQYQSENNTQNLQPAPLLSSSSNKGQVPPLKNPKQIQSETESHNPDMSIHVPNPAFNLPFPEAAYTSPHEDVSSHSFNRHAANPINESTPPPQQQPSPIGESGINSLMRKISTGNKRKDDVHRVASVKVTSKEKQQLQVPSASNQLSMSSATRKHIPHHQRATSAYTASIFNPENMQRQDQKPLQHSSSMRKYHPSARANSMGHSRKHSLTFTKSGTYTVDKNAPPLPSFNTNGTDYDGFFDDEMDNIVFDDNEKPMAKLTDKEIIEQFEKAPPNSMPSIEYPKTLFLKGFFSVQTTSTKPLPIIRYDIITVLPQLGVKFVEVKGGFICVHYPSIIDSPKKPFKSHTRASSISSPAKSIHEQQYHQPGIDNVMDDNNGNSNYVDHEGHLNKTNDTDGLKTPTLSDTSSNGLKSKGSLTNDQHAVDTTSYNSSDRLSNSSVVTPSKSNFGHRRKFSLGNGILGPRKGEKIVVSTDGQNYNVEYNIPNTPAPANLNRHSTDDSSESLTLDDTNGASDMLVSSRLEQQNYNRSPTIGGAQESACTKSRSSKTPLKFEIHIVKVPLVGLYGIQFKKVSGNTWLYKSLASEILSRLNL